ncbi:G-protein coupled receptor [Aureococcus anophagefferens]|nr:G-protein coupled receptor [Aureococcus anophagefferens]
MVVRGRARVARRIAWCALGAGATIAAALRHANDGRRRLLEYDFSERNLHVLTSIAIAESSLSFLGGLFVVFSFGFFPTLRSKFAFEQVAMMALADMGAALTYWFGSPRDRSGLCTSQAVLQQFFELSSTNDGGARARAAFTWGASAVFALLPLSTSSYGASGAWCWIRPRPRLPSAAWRFSIFVPVWIAIAYNGAVYANCAWVLERLRSVADDAAGEKLRGTIHRLARYPLILVACWSCATINRLQQIFAPDRPVFGLYVATVVTRSMLGFLNALAFGATANVRHEWRAFLAARHVAFCADDGGGAGALIHEATADPPSPTQNPVRKSENRASSIEMSNSATSERANLEDVDLGDDDDARGSTPLDGLAGLAQRLEGRGLARVGLGVGGPPLHARSGVFQRARVAGLERAERRVRESTASSSQSQRTWGACRPPPSQKPREAARQS